MQSGCERIDERKAKGMFKLSKPVKRPAGVKPAGVKKSAWAASGFSLLELLVVLAMLAIAMAFITPAIGPTLARAKLERATRETTTLLAQARMEAIQTGNPVHVRPDAAATTLESFADVNRDGIFNPTAGAPRKTTDYVVRRLPLPSHIDLAAPGSQPVLDGLTVQGGQRQAIFLPDGSIADVGAFRLADDRGHFREVRIEPEVTPRTRVQHWDGSAWVLKKNPSGAIR